VAVAKVHAEEKCDICVKLAPGVLQIQLSLLHLVLLFFFLLLILSFRMSTCLLFMFMGLVAWFK